MIKELDEHELCKELLSGNSFAIDEVVRRYTDMVYHVCLRMMKNESDAEDIVQSVFMRFVEKIHVFDKNTILEAWLYRTAIFTSLNQKAENKKNLHREMEIAEVKLAEFSNKPSVSEDLDKISLSGLIDHAILQLPERYREVIRMHFIGGHKKSDVADALGLKRSTLSMRLSKGLELVRENLSRAGLSTSLSAIACFMKEDMIAPAPHSLKILLQKKLGSSPQDSSRLAVVQTATAQGTSSGLGLVKVISAMVAFILIAGGALYLTLEQGGDKKGSRHTSLPAQTNGVDYHWIFEKDSTDDLIVKSGSWRWIPASKTARAQVYPDNQAVVEIQKKIPPQPLHVRMVIRLKSKRARGNFGLLWSNYETSMERSANPNLLKIKSLVLNLDIYFYKQYSVHFVDGKMNILSQYKEAYPSDRLAFTLDKFGLEELHIQTIQKDDLPEVLRSSDNFEKAFLKKQ